MLLNRVSNLCRHQAHRVKSFSSYTLRDLRDPLNSARMLGLHDPISGYVPSSDTLNNQYNDEMMYSSPRGFIGKVRSMKSNDRNRQVSVEYVRSNNDDYEYSAIMDFDHVSDVEIYNRDYADEAMLGKFVEDVADVMIINEPNILDEVTLRALHEDISNVGTDNNITIGVMSVKIKSTDVDDKTLGLYNPEENYVSILRFHHTGV